ncbi:MAG TPA: WD40 repeat domain-containing protein [Chloroflexia bacterium]
MGTTRLGRPIEAVEYSPDGRLLAHVSYYLAGGGAMLWQMPGPGVHPDSHPSGAGNVPNNTTLSGQGLVERTSLHIMDALAFSPGSNILAANDDNLIWLFRLDSYDIIAGLQKHTQHVTGLAFSPDGKTLASSSEDGTVNIWQVPALAPLPSPTP